MFLRRLMLFTKPIVKLKLCSFSIKTRQNMQMNFSTGGVDSMIKISKILREDHDKLTEFLLQNFFPYEPIGVALGINPEKDVGNWLHKYVHKHLEMSPQVSSQAVNSSGKLVGVSFSVIVDPRKPRPPLMVDYIDPTSQKVKDQISRFLDELEEGIDACELLGVTSLSTSSTDNRPLVLDNLMISVNKDYWRRGLTTQLIKSTEGFAKKYKDCRAAKVVVTSEFTYKAYLKCEYQVIREFQFEKYHDAEKNQIFKGKEAQLGVHKCGRVMIKQLQ